MEIRWDPLKNERLKVQRNVSFEMVLEEIRAGRTIRNAPHPKRANQRLLVVKLNGYVCGVPYVVDREGMFLKTIYQDRNLNSLYGDQDG